MGHRLAGLLLAVSHMGVGLRDVLLDYARPAGMRRFLLRLPGAGVFCTAAWILRVLRNMTKSPIARITRSCSHAIEMIRLRMLGIGKAEGGLQVHGTPPDQPDWGYDGAAQALS